VTEAALALAGCELHPFTRELTAKMGRGEITGDQAVAMILTRFLGRLPSPSAATLPTHDGSTLDPMKTAELSARNLASATRRFKTSPNSLRRPEPNIG
jgi:hypothetical protein